MNCELVEELLSDYLDNTLAPEESSGIALHLEVCSRCSNILADFRRFDRLIAQLPRVSPNPALRDTIFSSQEYLELTGTSNGKTEQTLPYRRVRRDEWNRPRLVALPGGRQYSSATSSDTSSSAQVSSLHSKPRRAWGQRIMQIMIAAMLLLTLGIGGVISWKLEHEQAQTAQHLDSITPPAGLLSGPLPVGMRFVFLREGTLWSSSADGASAIARLTPAAVTVAANWSVQPAQPGRLAGNLLAYIDLQQGRLHTIRSDGQSDTTLQQPLLKAGVQPSSVWDTDEGAAILGSLAWSKDGTMLAFVADPAGTGQPGLYLYFTGTNSVHMVPLPMQGQVLHPTWSPDSIRIAFTLVHDGKTRVLDYNTQNNGMLILTADVSTPEHPNDTILSLNWSANVDMPAITWSVGTMGQVHSIWMRHVGAGETARASMLVVGNYAQAVYNEMGGWLLLAQPPGQARQILLVDLNARIRTLATGREVSSIGWSPGGLYIDYFDALLSHLGTLHLVNVLNGADTLVAPGVVDTPVPAWFADSQRLLYSTGTHVFVLNVQTRASRALPVKGLASAFAWSVTSPQQLIVAVGDGQPGVYVVDLQHNTAMQLDKEDIHGHLLWTQIP